MHDVLPTDYFRSTNKKGKYLKQIIRNRLIQVLLDFVKSDMKTILYEFKKIKMDTVEDEDLTDNDDEDEVITYCKKNWYRMEEEHELEEHFWQDFARKRVEIDVFYIVRQRMIRAVQWDCEQVRQAEKPQKTPSNRVFVARTVRKMGLLTF
ncbi:unnamed protein product [Didymodactylos carnosus]|uniref:Uncharacterized protein n=1 Tax=Didymodactylos carnosus TaxID=1234261 RepID=A0A815KAC9_9BILA|nr:unnamed protein product [Didymodactylos carnosus]CAF1640228.1 unnamed protein product [Didymodactylos carnosus]CAF4287344.1 unnamed protein product [Didymodactylos carnosus]CAF4475894.1 unnamed protein product [Didymodactylos carnosus]